MTATTTTPQPGTMRSGVVWGRAADVPQQLDDSTEIDYILEQQEA